jgi:hypothetical protein
MTEHEAQLQIAAPHVSTPSVLTPSRIVPVAKDKAPSLQNPNP